MEILLEIIVQLLVWILEVLAELFLGLVLEAITSFLGHGISAVARLTGRRLRRVFVHRGPASALLGAIGCFFLGGAAGRASLWLVPELIIAAPWLRIANLVVTPLAAGGAMSLIGAFRRRRGLETVRLETFAFGGLFAFGLALARFLMSR